MYRKNVLQNKLVTLKSEIFVFAYLWVLWASILCRRLWSGSWMSWVLLFQSMYDMHKHIMLHIDRSSPLCHHLPTFPGLVSRAVPHSHSNCPDKGRVVCSVVTYRLFTQQLDVDPCPSTPGKRLSVRRPRSREIAKESANVCGYRWGCLLGHNT